MTHPLHNRNFLKELDFTAKEWGSLLQLAADLKEAKKAGREVKRLTDKNIALIFEKTSTRTRCSFEVAAYDQGAHVTYLDPSGSQMGHKESVADTARVLGRFYDGIEFRGKKQEHVEVLAELSGVPVWNGLTDEWHPTQMLADQLTMLEHAGKPIEEISFAYLGDARNNVANSLLISAALMGMDVRMVGPKELQTTPEVVAQAEKLAKDSGARILVTDDVAEGVKSGDFLYTETEISAMLHDIEVAKTLRVQGVVIGCLTPDGDIDERLLDRLLEAARPLSVTFHRAFDVCRDPHSALEVLIRHGVDRVLTSGQEATAPQGIPLLRELVRQADGRIIIMPGCGVRADNIARIEAETGAREFHTSARRIVESRMNYRNERVPMGSCAVTSEFETVQTDRREVARYLSEPSQLA